MRLRTSAACLFVTCLAAGSVSAEPILASPGSPSHDAPLATLASQYQRQQDVFASRELGISLDPFMNEADMQLVRDFFAQTAELDFETYAGRHPYDVVAWFDEYGDEGNFAGIASVGVAARLIQLRAEGAPADEIERARQAAIRAAKAWTVYGSIGGPGVVARGIRRTTPLEPGDPPIPGALPERTPFADAQGNPLPADKQATWRDPKVPGFEGWIWLDDTSKDQVSGYALAVGWLWDALHDDAAVPAEVVDDMAAGLHAFARSLMEVAPELGVDLCIRDADGRLTTFRDLNPRQVSPDSVLPEKVKIRNGFNAALALGILRAAYHVTGDAELGAFYYEDLVAKRDLPRIASESAGVIFFGAPTNYSNVNMLAIALATVGRFETDPYVRSRLDETLEHGFWSTGDDRDVSHVKQGWFDAVYGAYASAPPAAEIRARIAENLGGFQSPPAFQRERINCDDAEIAAGSCIGIDGTTTIELISGAGHGGEPVARDILPMSIRPDSDFLWRSDPHDVNGGGNNRMNPGGDFLAAYWLARVSDGDDTRKNVSPFARDAVPYEMADGGVGEDGGTSDATPSEESDDGCGCMVPGGDGKRGAGAGAALALATALLCARRRRHP